MNIHLIVAVVVIGAATCASKPIEPKCQCLRTAKSVRPQTIVKVKVNEPSSFCSKKEVILTIRNSPVPVCIDPNGEFFRYLDEQKRSKSRKLLSLSKTLPTTTRTEPTPAESSTASAKTPQTSSTSTSAAAKRQ